MKASVSAGTTMQMKSGHRVAGVGNLEKFSRLQKFAGILRDGGFIWRDLVGGEGGGKGFFLISEFIFIVLKMALILPLSGRNYPFYHF